MVARRPADRRRADLQPADPAVAALRDWTSQVPGRDAPEIVCPTRSLAHGEIDVRSDAQSRWKRHSRQVAVAQVGPASWVAASWVAVSWVAASGLRQSSGVLAAGASATVAAGGRG